MMRKISLDGWNRAQYKEGEEQEVMYNPARAIASLRSRIAAAMDEYEAEGYQPGKIIPLMDATYKIEEKSGHTFDGASLRDEVRHAFDVTGPARRHAYLDIQIAKCREDLRLSRIASGYFR